MALARWLLPILLLAPAVPAAAQALPPKAQESFDAAFRLNLQGKVGDAIAKYEEALGIAPLAAGCVDHAPLASDVARAPTVWTGDPIPIRVGVLGVGIVTGDEDTPPVIAEIVRKSLVNVLRSSNVILGVREVGPSASAAVEQLSAAARLSS